MSVTLGCAPGTCPGNPITFRVEDGPAVPLTFYPSGSCARVADLDALADQAPADEPPAPPEVAGIRVFIPGSGSMLRDHPHARIWCTQEDGTLLLDDIHGRTIAEYAPGRWFSVQDIFAEAAA